MIPALRAFRHRSFRVVSLGQRVEIVVKPARRSGVAAITGAA